MLPSPKVMKEVWVIAQTCRPNALLRLRLESECSMKASSDALEHLLTMDESELDDAIYRDMVDRTRLELDEEMQNKLLVEVGKVDCKEILLAILNGVDAIEAISEKWSRKE